LNEYKFFYFALLNTTQLYMIPNVKKNILHINV